MKNKISLFLSIASLVLLLCSAAAISAQTSAFTYQGRFNDSTVPSPTNGSYNMQFGLYDAVSGGNQIGGLINKPNVQVSNGIFTVSLDYGANRFDGGERFLLEIRIFNSSTGVFIVLDPRQPITSAPYAIRSSNAATADDSTRLGGVEASQYLTGAVVRTVNNLSGSVALAAGSNITITPGGNTLTIASTSPNGILNQTSLQTGANFNIDGTGAANIFNTTSQYNIGGDRVMSAPGSGNLFAGRRSGSSNTAGISNTFVGGNAGFANTTGSNNSFVGADAGISNTTGGGNTFVGSQAGNANTVGGNNSFFGRRAGTNNTTGTANSFFGAFAGEANTTGGGNSFFGLDAGLQNTTGLYNTFLGLSAGASSATGGGNTFIGSDVGIANTNGNNNAFIGRLTGVSNTTGGSNSFFGVGAGLNNVTGSNNTVIGAGGDVGASALTFATAVGALSVVSTSNTIALGRSDGSDKVRIFGLGAAGSTQLCRNASNEIATCSSSLRYKSNILPFSSGMSLLGRLRPISFEWRDGGMKDVGFAAEEVAAISPLLVNYNASGEVEGVKYDRLSVIFVNAIKQQQTLLERQMRRIDLLETRLAKLERLGRTKNVKK